MDPFSLLEQAVRGSAALGEGEKDEFLRALSFLTLPQQRLLCELFSEEPDLVPFMYKNFKRKRDNLKNPGAWEEIVREELEFLDSDESEK